MIVRSLVRLGLPGVVALAGPLARAAWSGLIVDFILVGLAGAPGWLPLRGGLFATHDGYFHLYRLIELESALRAGDPYPRWAPDFALGFGYPVFNFYPPLALWLAMPGRLLGLGPIAALNLEQAIAIVVAGLGAYGLGRTLFGRAGGVVAGVAFTSLPYLLLDVYIRGAVAETTAVAALPWVAWGLIAAARSPRRSTIALASAAVGLLVLAHNITALLALPPLALVALALVRPYRANGRSGQVATVAVLRSGENAGRVEAIAPADRAGGRSTRWWSENASQIAGVAVVLALGLALSGVYWLPALLERDDVATDRLTTQFFDFHNQFNTLRGVVQTTAAFEYRYASGSFLFKVGLAQLGLSLVAAGLALGRGRRRASLVWLAVLLIGLLLQTSRAQPLWDLIPLLAFVQFPWRLLALVGLASAMLLAGATAAARPGAARVLVAVGLLGPWLAASYAGLSPEPLDLREDEVSRAALGRIELDRHLVGTTTTGEYTPRWVERDTFVGWRDPGPDLPAPAGIVAASRVGPSALVVGVDAERPTTLVLDQYYFPGWTARDADVVLAGRPLGPRGLLAFDLPPGRRDFAIALVDTPARLAGRLASAAGLIGVLVLLASAVGQRLNRSPGTPHVSPESVVPGAMGRRSSPRRPFVLAQAAPAPRSGAVGQRWRGAGRLAFVRTRVSRRMALVGVGAGIVLVGVGGAIALGSGGARVLSSVGGTMLLGGGDRAAPPAASARVTSAHGLGAFAAGPRLLDVAPVGGGQLDLLWTTDAATDRSLTVALRLLDGEGRVVARRDKAPRYGLRPTELWRPGGIIRDLQDLRPLPGRPIDPAARYQLVIGLFDAAGYVEPRDGAPVRWTEACPCAAPDRAGIGISAGMLAGATLPPAPDGGVASGKVAGGRVALRDLVIALPEPPRPGLLGRLAGRLPASVADRLPLPVSPPTGSPRAHMGGAAGTIATLARGDTIVVRPTWLALTDLADDEAVFVHLLDHNRQLVAQDDEWPRRGFSPTSLWHTGQVVADRYAVRVPPTVGPARLPLELGLYRRGDLRRLTWSGEPAGRDALAIGDVKVAPPAPVAPVVRPIEALFGGAIALRGLLTEPTIEPVGDGRRIVIAPRWEARAAPGRDYTVFVHLGDASGRVIANGDAPPLGGGYPTSLWEPGETIDDRYEVRLPAGWRGAATIAIGFYRPDTGARLATERGADSVELARLAVEPP